MRSPRIPKPSNARPASRIIAARAEWPEATVVAEPISEKRLTGPRLLVKRNLTTLLGSREEQLVYLPGRSAISLFTGAGGMDLGLEQAGFVTLVQHERWDAACETLLANRPQYFRHAALIQGDINATPTELLLKEAGLRVGEADIVVGGPPCQGFSTAGKRQLNDQRNDLVWQFLRVVREAKPRFFTMENVPGFISFNRGEYMREFLRTAYDCYYELVYGLVNAVEYGVPQDRTRFLCMGTRRDLVAIEGILGSLPKPECFAKSDLRAIRSLRDRAMHGELGLLTHPPGIRYFPDRKVLIPPRPVDSRGGEHRRSLGFIEFYERLRRDEPDRIVDQPKHAEGLASA